MTYGSLLYTLTGPRRLSILFDAELRRCWNAHCHSRAHVRCRRRRRWNLTRAHQWYRYLRERDSQSAISILVEIGLEYVSHIPCCNRYLEQYQYSSQRYIYVKETRKHRLTSDNESDFVRIFLHKFSVTYAFYAGVIGSWAPRALL